MYPTQLHDVSYSSDLKPYSWVQCSILRFLPSPKLLIPNFSVIKEGVLKIRLEG